MSSGLAGAPFSLPSGNLPQSADLVFGGSMTPPQAGQSVQWTVSQLLASLGNAPISVSAFNTAFLTWMASLPTTLPSAPGVAWNNSGTPSVSQP